MRVLPVVQGREGRTYTHYIANKQEYFAALDLKRQAETQAKQVRLVENYDGTFLLTVENLEGRKKVEDDRTHCCGRYVKNAQDRRHHDSVFHKEILS